jgi:hypothetical protein
MKKSQNVEDKHEVLDQPIYNARTEKLSLLIGTVVGQISELLNNMVDNPLMDTVKIYKRLYDIHQAAGLQIHELYYKARMIAHENHRASQRIY